jgi:hypothetical protein
MSPFWRQDLGVGTWICGKFVDPCLKVLRQTLCQTCCLYVGVTNLKGVRSAQLCYAVSVGNQLPVFQRTVVPLFEGHAVQWTLGLLDPE